MAVFTESMINERFQAFWAALQRGEFITDAAAEAGTYRKKGARWMAAAVRNISRLPQVRGCSSDNLTSVVAHCASRRATAASPTAAAAA